MAVTRADWKYEPIVSATTIDLETEFTAAEFVRIQTGFKPRNMDDRWFAFWEFPRLHLARSWTGHCVFEVEIEQTSTGAKALRALVDADRSRFRMDDPKEQRELLLKILTRYASGDWV